MGLKQWPYRHNECKIMVRKQESLRDSDWNHVEWSHFGRAQGWDRHMFHQRAWYCIFLYCTTIPVDLSYDTQTAQLQCNCNPSRCTDNDLVWDCIVPIVVVYKGGMWWLSFSKELSNAFWRLHETYLQHFPSCLLDLMRNIHRVSSNFILFESVL